MTRLKEKREERKEPKERESKKENRRLRPRARGETIHWADMDAYSQAVLDELWERGIVYADIFKTAQDLGMGKRELAAWLRYQHDTGFKFRNGDGLNRLNFRRPMRMWHIRALERGEASEPTPRESERAARERAMAEKPESWLLCQERCAHAGEPCGCLRGVRTPPDHDAKRPYPPEECPYFARKPRS